MGKPIKHLSKGKVKSTLVRTLTWKMTLAVREKGRGGGGTVVEKDPCMVIRAQPKCSQ